MIDWWALLRSALWVVGLAVVVASAGIAGYQASMPGDRLRGRIARTGLWLGLAVGLGLACLGWSLGGGPWWARITWGLLAALFAASAGLQWRQGRRAGAATPTGREAQVGGEGRPAVRRTRRIAWLLVIAGLAVTVAWGTMTGVRMVQHARSLQTHLRSLETMVQGSVQGEAVEVLGAACEQVAAMRHDLTAIEDQAGSLLPLLRILRYVPRYGGDLVAASDLLDLAAGVASSGDRVCRSLVPALVPGRSLVEQLPAAVVAARAELETARQELAAAKQARARIDAGRLSPQVAGLVGRLDRTMPWLETAVDGLLLAPQLLGADGPRTYLLIAQNNDELRPTGGFISGVGELHAASGRLSSLTFEDSYAVDNWEVPHDFAPADMQATLGAEPWLFRDANWEADFPSSARRAMEIYARDRGVDADGVIALDLTALVWLVEALSPLQVEGIDGAVTGQNVVQAIQAGWQRPPDLTWPSESEWFEHRKDSFAPIAAAAMDKLLSGSDLDLLRLARTLKRALDEKHILVYLEEPRSAGTLSRMTWDGAMPDPPGRCDFLMVADANVGFNKMDARVERSITYRVELGIEGRPTVRLTLGYRNLSQKSLPFCVQEARYGETYADMMDRCYWDYVRAYVPAGSVLVKGPDLTIPTGSLLARKSGGSKPGLKKQIVEGGWTAWTAFFDLAPGEERTLTLEYTVPHWVAERSLWRQAYCLQVRKQPGTEAVPFCLEVVPPPGFAAAEWAPAELALDGPACTDLPVDRQFEIVYRYGGNP